MNGSTIKSPAHNREGRPVAAIVALDPAYSGDMGIAILVRPPSTANGLAIHSWRSAPPLSVATQRWVGERVSEVCRPGERIVLVTESDAFGGQAVARKLGIGVGSIEGLLLDLNAMDPDSRVDVSQGTWRKVIRLADGSRAKKGLGREALKAMARAYVLERFEVSMPEHAAEAVGVGCWYDSVQGEWGKHVRPVPVTPTGMRKR